ncbi:MAG TPA: amidohydrolase family protein [Halanaerobiales bacterium]|nr:amidohydrolase family protein [Halanaerobiales bacterium]
MQKVIDTHVHVGNSAALYVGGSIDIVVARMEQHGITHSVISPIPGFEDPEGVKTVEKMNKQVSVIRENNQNKFPMAFGVAEARHGKIAVEEAAYALGELGLDGLMFHHDFSGVEIHAPIMFEILEEVRNYNSKVIQLHTAQHSMLEPPFSVWILAERFPEITFIIGHPMMSMIQLENMVAIVKHCPNVYMDTCCTWYDDFAIETVIEKIGSSDNIMFGTDNPYYNLNVCIDKKLVEEADISQEDKDKIFYKNFERVFKKVGE